MADSATLCSSAFAAACLAVGLSTAWAPAAKGDVQTRVSLTGFTSLTVIHGTLLLDGVGSSGGDDGRGGTALRNLTIPANTLSPSGLTYIWDIAVSSTSLTGRYAMIGLAEGSGSMHVVVSTPGLTWMHGRAFSDVFQGVNEQALIDAMLVNPDAGINFLRSNFAILLQQGSQDASCVAFSNGSDAGYINVTISAVPAPAAVALLPIGIIAARRRRRA